MSAAKDSDAAGKREFWRDRWHEGRTGWDLGGPHAALSPLLEAAESLGYLRQGTRILEPGCGRAHGGAFMAGHGYVVTSFDVIEQAVSQARQLYHNIPGLVIEVGDALCPKPQWLGAFAAVVDRAMLCALPAAFRPRYVQAMATVLEPGGIIMSIPFTKLSGDAGNGPPYAITRDEVQAICHGVFDLVYWQDLPQVVPVVGGKVEGEALLVLKKCQ